jgi:hypothetical protein
MTNCLATALQQTHSNLMPKRLLHVAVHLGLLSLLVGGPSCKSDDASHVRRISNLRQAHRQLLQFKSEHGEWPSDWAKLGVWMERRGWIDIFEAISEDFGPNGERRPVSYTPPTDESPDAIIVTSAEFNRRRTPPIAVLTQSGEVVIKSARPPIDTIQRFPSRK